MRDVAHGGDAGRLRGRIDVEGAADPVDRIDHMRGAVHPAEPQRRQPVDLRERAAHHDVVGCRDELDAGLVIIFPHVLRIGGIEHEQHMRRQTAMQPLHLVERHVGAGRIVRIGEKDRLGALAHRCEDRIDVRGVVLFRGHDRGGARAEDRDRINQEAVRGVDRLVAVGQIGVGDEIEQIVGAGAADDAVGIEPESAPDRLAQLGRGAVRIVLEMLGERAIGGDRLRARAERRLVRGKLDHARDAGRRAPARHIGIDGEHAGARLRTKRGGHFTPCRGLWLLDRPLPARQCCFTGRSGPAARLWRGPYSGSRGFRRDPRPAPTRRP